MSRTRLTRTERLRVWQDKMDALDAEIAPLLRAGKVRAAIDKTVMVVAAHSIGVAEFFDGLEDRVAALETAAKPRHRVAAPSRRT